MQHGPIPKRQSQRRRKTPAAPVTKGPSAPATEPPASSDSWHPVARMWFDSLGQSGQSSFYVASDWTTAWVAAEALSRELKPQPLVVAGVVEMHEVPPKAATLAAFLKACTALMATEGDRRRLRLELDRPTEGQAEEVGGVSDLDRYRARLSRPSG